MNKITLRKPPTKRLKKIKKQPQGRKSDLLGDELHERSGKRLALPEPQGDPRKRKGNKTHANTTTNKIKN